MEADGNDEQLDLIALLNNLMANQAPPNDRM